MRYVYKQKPQQFERFAKHVFSIDAVGEEAILKGIDAFKAWLRKVGAPVSLRDVGIPAQDIDRIVENVMKQGPSFGVLKKLGKEDVKQILLIASQ